MAAGSSLIAASSSRRWSVVVQFLAREPCRRPRRPCRRSFPRSRPVPGRVPWPMSRGGPLLGQLGLGLGLLDELVGGRPGPLAGPYREWLAPRRRPWPSACGARPGGFRSRCGPVRSRSRTCSRCCSRSCRASSSGFQANLVRIASRADEDDQGPDCQVGSAFKGLSGFIGLVPAAPSAACGVRFVGFSQLA